MVVSYLRVCGWKISYESHIWADSNSENTLNGENDDFLTPFIKKSRDVYKTSASVLSETRDYIDWITMSATRSNVLNANLAQLSKYCPAFLFLAYEHPVHSTYVNYVLTSYSMRTLQINRDRFTYLCPVQMKMSAFSTTKYS